MIPVNKLKAAPMDEIIGIFLLYEKSLSIKILSIGTALRTSRKYSALTEIR